MNSPRREIGNPTKTFSSSTPHFLMMIPKGTSGDIKLSIPKKFLRKYGDDLSNPVLLKLPNGSKWNIELRRWEGEAWFDKGWPEFSEFYFLEHCHSLVFGYEGNSKFHICIFDESFIEIEYPLTMPEMKETDADDDSSDESDDHSDDASLEILDKFPPCPRKSKGKSSFPCPRPHKKKRTSSSGNVDFPSKRHDRGTSSTPRFLKRTQVVRGRRHPLTTSGKALALQRAKAYKSDKPSFIVPMHRSYIGRHPMWLTSDFSILMGHLSKNSANVILWDLGGRAWVVEFIAKPRAKFQSGWHEFVRGNNLNVNDVCVFVLIDDTRLVFEVVIFRAVQAANCTLLPDVDGEETEEDDDSALPAKFVKEHLNQAHDKAVLRVSDERTCKSHQHFSCILMVEKYLRSPTFGPPVNVKKADDKFFFQKGWKKFVHDRVLKLCEFLVFGYAGNLGFYVDIYGRDGCKKKFVTAIRERGRRHHEEGHGNVIHRRSPRHHGKQNLPSIDPIKYEATDTESETSMHPLATSTGKTIALPRNNSFNSEKPFFKSAIQNSYIRRGYMYLPRNFGRTHLTEQRATVTLRVSDGKTWPVKLAIEGERAKLRWWFHDILPR
ncbi:PREDICTED: putative B3 domain-containing protein Os03g0621600 [Prunus mume]|uniref:B3 domain-containing protein Os03g0621600 n=1 Tax=Prunus mume TaxID=102107 RepID=A0ABM1LVX3_PRUMU|nr:PREDICTED: putative B3 domain-containing protein Os03g0621600 [Prunus mume]